MAERKRRPEIKQCDGDGDDGHRLILETRGEAVALICSGCQRPYITVEGGKAIILNRHGQAQHKNELLPGELTLLRLIAETQARTGHSPEIL